jgi:hypothetical protein
VAARGRAIRGAGHVDSGGGSSSARVASGTSLTEAVGSRS